MFQSSEVFLVVAFQTLVSEPICKTTDRTQAIPQSWYFVARLKKAWKDLLVNYAHSVSKPRTTSLCSKSKWLQHLSSTVFRGRGCHIAEFTVVLNMKHGLGSRKQICSPRTCAEHPQLQRGSRGQRSFLAWWSTWSWGCGQHSPTGTCIPPFSPLLH